MLQETQAHFFRLSVKHRTPSASFHSEIYTAKLLNSSLLFQRSSHLCLRFAQYVRHDFYI
jgi:hypothetical protein